MNKMNSKMDSFDYKLVAMSGQNARTSSEVLAKELNVSSATIRRRLKKLIKENALHIIGVVDPAKFGFSTSVVINLNVVHEKVTPAMFLLAGHKEVVWLAAVTGRYDIIFTARFTTPAELSNFLRNTLSKIEGLRDSETYVCLDIGKGRFIPFT